MNIAVVDDSDKDRAYLRTNIENYAKENALWVHITEYASGEDFLEQAPISVIDAVFLDIYMDQMSGMDVAHAMRQSSLACQIIFVTTSSDFAVQSYEVRAFYYILKPYNYEEISHVLDILDETMKQSSRYIKVKEGRDWCKVFLSDILYVDYRNHYVQIHTESEIISTYLKFSEIEKILSAYARFLKCYRCIIVNMDKITKVDGLFFLISNGEYIPLNRKQAPELKVCYSYYIFKTLEQNDSIKQ